MNTTYTITSLNELTNEQLVAAGGIFGTILTLGIVICVLLIIAGWKIFEKAGEKGWKILIPIYDVYILFKICNLKNWFWAMLCASLIASILMGVNMPPTVEDATGYHIAYDIDWSQYPTYLIGLIMACIVSIATEVAVAIRLAKAFGKGVGYTLGLIFLPNIFTLILGFGNAKYSAKKLGK